MNCLYETVASAYINLRSRFAPPPSPEDLLGDAEENLESCRNGLLARERDLSHQCDTQARAAVSRKRAGDVNAARFAVKASPCPMRLALSPCFDLRA
jgi:hypothetical protein